VLTNNIFVFTFFENGAFSALNFVSFTTIFQHAENGQTD